MLKRHNVEVTRVCDGGYLCGHRNGTPFEIDADVGGEICFLGSDTDRFVVGLAVGAVPEVLVVDLQKPKAASKRLYVVPRYPLYLDTIVCSSSGHTIAVSGEHSHGEVIFIAVVVRLCDDTFAVTCQRQLMLTKYGGGSFCMCFVGPKGGHLIAVSSNERDVYLLGQETGVADKHKDTNMDDSQYTIAFIDCAHATVPRARLDLVPRPRRFERWHHYEYVSIADMVGLPGNNGFLALVTVYRSTGRWETRECTWSVVHAHLDFPALSLAAEADVADVADVPCSRVIGPMDDHNDNAWGLRHHVGIGVSVLTNWEETAGFPDYGSILFPIFTIEFGVMRQAWLSSCIRAVAAAAAAVEAVEAAEDDAEWATEGWDGCAGWDDKWDNGWDDAEWVTERGSETLFPTDNQLGRLCRLVLDTTDDIADDSDTGTDTGTDTAVCATAVCDR